MGLKGLLKLINDNRDKVCSEVKPVRGKLLVDGYGVLHELYDSQNLEWANGGCYAQQHKATTDFFNFLIRSGVEPIVILDGGGTKASIDDTVHRRNRNISKLTESLKKYQEGRETTEHHFPLLSRHVYIRSLKEIAGLQVYMGDGKAHQTIVHLANHYGCPILTNNTNYCVSGVAGGVIFYKHLDITSCRAPVYYQDKLINFLKLPDPNLIFAIIAIMGDGSEESVAYFYHGKIKAYIERSCSVPDIALKNRSWILNVTDYLKNQHINSWKEFKARLRSSCFGGQSKKLASNCEKAQDKYNLPVSDLSPEKLVKSTNLRSSSSRPLPDHILRDYRACKLPATLVDAICVGECILDPNVGDEEQSPIPLLGHPIREMMYGMALHSRRRVKEYYRSERKPWEYAPVEVVPKTYAGLSIMQTEDGQIQEDVAKSAICEVLQSPDILSSFQDPHHKRYALATLATCYWARHVIRSQQLDHPEQLIKALVLNFLYSRDLEESEMPSQHVHPMWVKVYHALLEWQSLYQDVCNLNSTLQSPLQELPLTNIVDGPFVMELALHPSPDIITTFRGRLNATQEDTFDLIIKIIDI